METVSGNFALLGSRPKQNAVTVQKVSTSSTSTLPCTSLQPCSYACKAVRTVLLATSITTAEKTRSNNRKLLDAGAIIMGTGTLSELSYWKYAILPVASIDLTFLNTFQDSPNTCRMVSSRWARAKPIRQGRPTIQRTSL